MKRRFEPRALHVFFIAIVAIVFYARTLDNYWIKDDLSIHVMTGDTMELSFDALKGFLWPSHMESEQFWRPVPMLIGFLDYSLWGTNPAGYHVANTLLHALVGILAYFLVNRLTNFVSPVAGLVAGLAMVLNPINPEAVVWILQRMVLLCCVFSLATMLTWLKAVETGKIRWRVVSLFLLTLAILCKEVAVTLPGCLFLVDLLYGDKSRSLRDRTKVAMRWALPCAGLLVLYLGCRYAMWGRFDLKYAGREPAEYARDFRVFERMTESLRNCVTPINRAVFEGKVADSLFYAMIVAYLMAAARGVVLWAKSAVYRKFLLLCTAFFALSFFPTIYIFWITDFLFNGRFFYEPGLAILMAVAISLWLPFRDGDVHAGQTRGIVDTLWARSATLLLVGSFAVSLAGGLTAFDEAGEQVRGLQLGVARYGESQRTDDLEPVVVAFNSPSEVKGVPTLVTYLEWAVRPPLWNPPVICYPLIDVMANQGSAWYDTLKARVESEGIAPERLRYVECHFHPPGVRPLFGEPEVGTGAYPAELVEPADNSFFANGDQPEPSFVFRPTGKAERFVLVLEGRDLQEGLRIEVRPGVNAERTESGDIRYALENGDPRQPDMPNVWDTLIRQPLPHPIAVTWRVESYDAKERLIGVSGDFRVVIINVR